MSQMYDAVILVSFGGPESREEVIPFLENVLRGRNVPYERMMEVAEHYYHFGGVSPINEQNRALIAALAQTLKERGPNLPIYWGNRNWHPMLADTLRQMSEDGVKRALALVTSAFSSYSGCRQYQDDIARARRSLGDRAPRVDKLRVFYNHPEFIGANIEILRDALASVPEERHSTTEVLFSAHSIPQSMADSCDYVSQLNEAARLIVGGVGWKNWRLVFQSRSGPPSQPWLEPDVSDCAAELKQEGKTDIVVCPIGFLSDHMEVIFDLDTELKENCQKIGLNLVRAATVGVHPLFIGMIRELILERMNTGAMKRYLGTMGPRPDFCPIDCCPGPRR
ncbi:MAG: ferrochelatase [Acidobacteriota bacterium]|nr:MAG: ferrochelatase [Acidobacteriota bacterium]